MLGGISPSQSMQTVQGTAVRMRSVPIFLLVPKVKLHKRPDPARNARAAQEKLPGAIVENRVNRRLT